MSSIKGKRLSADEKPKWHYEFEVAGSGQFPFDMLRYDSCWPADEASAHRMAHDRERRTVKLFGYTQPTDARWASFMWRVQ